MTSCGRIVEQKVPQQKLQTNDDDDDKLLAWWSIVTRDGPDQMTARFHRFLF